MTYLPPLFPEFKADKPDEQHTGAMIALRPRQDHVDRLAIEGGEPPQELHTTILFLGKADEYDYDTRARIIYAMRDVAQYFRVVEGVGFGINMWNPNGEDPCIVLGVGGKDLVEIRNAIIDAVGGLDISLKIPENHEPWSPHVTLEYTEDLARAVDLTELTGPIHYDAIRVAFGGIVDDIDLLPITAETEGYRYGSPSYVGGNRYDMTKTLRQISDKADALSIKLITPGGRVGSDASLGSRSNGENWVERSGPGRLPKYIRIVANGIKGKPKSQRIALAVAAMRRWARGGNNVSPKVQAAAAKAIAEWDAMVAAS
jgi:2'-5' RNA ligase